VIKETIMCKVNGEGPEAQFISVYKITS